ncbi:MAG: polysaccharide deacetylase family protein [Proteobacteria bacterium]|jgi:peptidoglycan/xylan/chitin deacetylase (PgdA/CDA1 family)|nr:polysaccharide deacetylase family protein [Pseudomonadota bacterium]
MGLHALGSLSDLQYKIKPADGNRLEAFFPATARVLRGGEAPGCITFTFDDGPDHRTTPVLLDQLDRYGVKGTFFVNGARFHGRTAGGEENQAVLRDIYRRGHFIGSHTFSHQDITALDDAGWKSEVSAMGTQIQGITGRPVRLFRPPFGRVSSETLSRLSAEGLTVVMWNLDSLDWQATTVRQLVSRAQQLIDENPEGGIFLLHDTNRNTAEAFPLIMEYLASRNEMRKAQGKSILRVVGIDQFLLKK